MEIIQLDREEYRGREYRTAYTTGGYYEVEYVGGLFRLLHRNLEAPKTLELGDTLLSDWLEDPVLFGAFEGETLLGLGEGSPETWNNRYRISNLCVFEEAHRRRGVGQALMARLLAEARAKGARMAVLETQTCNERAIAFYRKMGFEVIGLDRYAYSNEDSPQSGMRLEMGKVLAEGAAGQ